jgi:hypothetical protein
VRWIMPDESPCKATIGVGTRLSNASHMK